MRTSRVLLLAACGLLAGCFGREEATRAPERVMVASDTVAISGPPGFCVDLESTRDQMRSAFVLLGGCSSLTGRITDPSPRIPAILTASVGPPTPEPLPSAPVLDGWVRSDAGRSAMSAGGNADDLEVIETLTEDGVFYVHAHEHGGGALDSLDRDYWRAFFSVAGRHITATIRAAADTDTAQHFATLDAFADRIRSENAEARPRQNLLSRLIPDRWNNQPQTARSATGGDGLLR